MTQNTKTVTKVSYTKEIAKFGMYQNDFWTLNFDKQLIIKISKDNKDSKEKIDYLEKWLLCGGEKEKKEEEKMEKIDFVGTISAEILVKIFPLVTDKKNKDFLPFINKYLTEFGITTCEERIHFFSQIAEETTQMKDLTENSSGYASSKSKYKGRGLIQLTGSNNYGEFEKYCKELGDNVDFINNPEEIANNPKYAVLSAFWYWKINKKCSQYCTNLSEESLLKVSKLVNCGNIKSCGTKTNPTTGEKERCYECKPNGWEKRKTEFERLKKLYPCK